MKKVIIDGVTYRAVTPDVKEEKRREFYGVVFHNESTNICNGYLWKEERSAKNSGRGSDGVVPDINKYIEIRDSEIIVSEDDVSRIIGLFADGMCEVDCLKVLFKKDGV